MDDIILKEENGKILANSREVAKRFGKQHGSVLKTIQGENRNGYHANGLIDELKEKDINVSQYFIRSSYINRGKTYVEYLMTRDGFSLLVMGFTGKNSLEWKLKYIEAFNIMENKYYSKKPLENNNKLYLHKAKSVYVLLADDGSVKIGVSNNVSHRKHTLENYTGKTIVNYFYTNQCSNSFKIESMAHDYFSKDKIYGEWFNIDFRDACEYVKNLYDNFATYSYRNREDDIKNIDRMFDNVHLTRKDKISDVDSIKEKLQKYVEKGILDHVPENFNDAIKILCDQRILYYTRIKEYMT